MISIEGGAALSTFIDTVTLRLACFSEVILCAPFIDPSAAQRLSILVDKAHREFCGVTVITTPHAAKFFANTLSDSANRQALKISVRRDLHAKVYLAIARRRGGPSEAMITSANLTSAAFSKNLELGVRITTRSAHGRALVTQIRSTLLQLSN